MAEPLLPNHDPDDASTAAAEPGPVGPSPRYPEEPDVLPADDAGADTDAAPVERPNPLFRRPTPGERLHPDELAAELGEQDPRS